MLFLYCLSPVAIAQHAVKDTVRQPHFKFSARQLIIPSVLIGYGGIGLQSDGLQKFNRKSRKAAQQLSINTKIDNITLVLPALSVYALNAAGIKGAHDFRDRTVILLTASVITYSSVVLLKDITKVTRPDGTTNDSFPSGHTATAFAGAEMLRLEYKEVSVWYGIGGYTIAAGTAFLRVANDRHWLTDVAAGAGIGILGTKIAYWLNPFLTRTLFQSSRSKTVGAAILPFYNGTHTGIFFSATF